MLRLEERHPGLYTLLHGFNKIINNLILHGLLEQLTVIKT